MANNFTAIERSIQIARDIIEREPLGVIRAAYIDGDFSRAAKGQEIEIPLSKPRELKDIVPGPASPQADDTEYDETTISITNFKETDWGMTGEEELKLNNGQFGAIKVLADNIAQGAKIITNGIEKTLYGEMNRACRAYGSPGEVLFDTPGDFRDLSFARKILVDNGAPGQGAWAVINSTAGANMRGRQAAATVQADDSLLRDAEIIRTMGFNIVESFAIDEHAASGAAGWLVNQAASAIGDTTITIDTGATDPIPGDVFTIAGDANQYVVRSYADNVITINRPGLRIAAADNAALTFLANHTQNMIVSPNTLMLASRLPASPEGGDAATFTTTFRDAKSGLVYMLKYYPQYHQSRWEMSAAWGSGMVNTPRMAMLIGT